MNPRFTLILFTLLSGLLYSCSSTKDLTYLQDMEELSTISGQPAEAPDYRLKANDNLYISIQSGNQEVLALFNSSSGSQSGTTMNYSNPADQYIYGYLIAKDSTITLPVVGKIAVAGLTLAEAQSRVQLKTNEYLKGALAKVKMLNYKITLLGEFKSPGVYYNYNPNISVLEAVALAGGLTDYSKLSRLLVVRKTPDGTKSYRIDLTNKNVFAHPAYYLQPNDIVYAEPTKTKTLQVNTPVIALTISSISLLLAIFALIQ